MQLITPADYQVLQHAIARGFGSLWLLIFGSFLDYQKNSSNLIFLGIKLFHHVKLFDL